MKLWDITLKLILCCRGYGAVHKFSFSSSFIFFYHVLCLCLQSKPVSNYIVCLSVCEQHWIWWHEDRKLLWRSTLWYTCISHNSWTTPIIGNMQSLEWSNVSCLIHVAETRDNTEEVFPVWSSSAQHGHHRTDSGQREAASGAGRAIDFPSNIYTDITIISQHHNTVLSAEASLEI